MPGCGNAPRVMLMSCSSILIKAQQAVVFVDDKKAPCTINKAAAELLGLPNCGEVDPVLVANGMRRLADRSKIRANTYR